MIFIRSYAAVTFSAPSNTVVTLKGEYWQRTANIVCDHDDTLSVDFCSPSLAVMQGPRLDKFYRSGKSAAVLATAKPAKQGWSSFSRRFRTKGDSSTVTLYLMQESSGRFSSSYFANLRIERHRPIALLEDVPLKIDCDLPDWQMHNAVRLCNISHEGRENVLVLNDGGSWYGN